MSYPGKIFSIKYNNISYPYLHYTDWVYDTSQEMCIGSNFVVICGGLVSVDFTNILRGYFTSIGAMRWFRQWQLSNPVQ